MLFTIAELIDLVIMIIAIGYIFSTFIKKPPTTYDPLTYYKNTLLKDIKTGIMFAAPAIVFHELAHKFVAMGFGAQAELHAPIGWYLLIILARLMNFPFMFFVGGYVSVSGNLTYFQHALISAAGPFTNLLLFLMFTALIKSKIVKRKYHDILHMSARLNLFLFAFNLIPLPGFDGFNFFRSLFYAIF